MADNLTALQKVVGAFEDALHWVQEYVADNSTVAAMYQAVGADPSTAGPLPQVQQGLLDKLARFRSADEGDIQGFLEIVDDIIALFENVKKLEDQLGNPAEDIIYAVLGLLVTNYVRLRYPLVYWFFEPIVFLENIATSDPIVNANTVAFGKGFKKVGLFLADFLFRDPPKAIRQIQAFFVETREKFPSETEEDAERWATFVLQPLAISLAYLERKFAERQIEAPSPALKRDGTLISDNIFGWDPSPVSTTPLADRIANRTLTFSLIGIQSDAQDETESTTAISVTTTFVPKVHGGPGLLIALGGSQEVEQELGKGFKLLIKLNSASAVDFFIGGVGVDSPINGPQDASLTVTIERAPDTGGVPQVWGSRSGTRLESERLLVSGELSKRSSGIKAVAQKSALVLVASKDADGFINKILPEKETRITFDLGIGYATDRGFFIEGGTGLETILPIGKSIGPTHIQHLTLKLAASTDEKPAHITSEASLALSVNFGPVKVSVERIGFQIRAVFPENDKTDFEIGFKPPNGAGLSIDEAGFTGGGFLLFNKDKSEYAGMVDLTIVNKIAVKGTGLITTRLPDGDKGFSLLVIITAEGFDPIPLGLGFKLTAIGGLLAINRTFDENALRAGLKNHTLESILFPKDPIRNAPQILSTLNKVFPPAPGHHLFGPAARIEWGTPTLITADVALVLELGARLRLLALAHIAAILPKPENDLIRLQMAAIGLIDFDQGMVALDASLHDSRLVKKFALTGDMALRLNWEGPPNFALAVGGLHPAFFPPPNFPKLERIAINLTAGDNPRLRCEAYFALTANTVQFGARAELFVSAAGFSLQGEVGFDVLLQIAPFAFLADFFAQVQVKRGSTNLLKVRVEGALAGPLPLHIKAKATFEVLWWDISVRIDKTLVEGVAPPPAAVVDVLAQLIEALSQPGNWVGRLPDGQRPMVTLRARAGVSDDVLLHPLGVLTVKQNVVPLEMAIARFGQNTPAGDRRFAIRTVSLGGPEEKPQYVRDFFAPAQFFEMSDADKLSSPAFEQLAAGVNLGAHAITFNPNDCLQVEAIEFETKIYDKVKNKMRSDDVMQSSDPGKSKQAYTLSSDRLLQQAQFGAAATSDLRRTGRTKYQTTVGKYKVAKEGWSLVGTDDLTLQPAAAGRAMSYSEAEQALGDLKQREPAKAARLKILRFQSEVQAVK